MSVYTCSKCAQTFPSYSMSCPGCGEWMSLAESAGLVKRSFGGEPPVVIGDAKAAGVDRIKSGLAEFDQVMGGGIVPGSAVLIGGDPGIGKSTILLQISNKLPHTTKILYVSSEESVAQTRTRAERLGINHPALYVVSETNVNKIITYITVMKPDIVIIDSIQMVYRDDIDSAPGSITQVRESATDLIYVAKKFGQALFLVGHITKDGSIAGPKMLEHLVDTVLYFEGERSQTHRILRAIKNRFGATNEIGVFDMADSGLTEAKPSEFIRRYTAGTALTIAMAGTRPIIIEIEALTADASATPVHRFNGVDANRVEMILSVLARAGIKTCDSHIYLNVVGGMTIDEPAGDLAIALAIMSSAGNIALGRAAFIGEIGLTGDIRTVTGIDIRVKEARRMGLRIVVPADCRIAGDDVVPAATLAEIIKKIAGDVNAGCGMGNAERKN